MLSISCPILLLSVDPATIFVSESATSIYIRDLILLGLVKKAFRLNADLDHFVSRFIPGDRIHHFFSLGSIRRNVLAHGKLLILKHWFKICHLLS